MTLRNLLLLGIGLGLGLAGCQHAAPADAGAEPFPDFSEHSNGVNMVARGKNVELKYKAAKPGTLYVFDTDSGEFVFRSPLAANDTFVLEPGADFALINKERTDLDHGTNERDEYKVYFVPDPQ